MSGKTRSRLGRGLNSLMALGGEVGGASGDGETSGTDVSPSLTTDASPPPVVPSEVALSDIRPNPFQPRRAFDEAALAGLAESLKSSGLVQPVVVRKVRDGYELIAGERRWRAAKMAGLDSIPVLIRDVDSLTQAQMALVENIQREDLNPMERAAAYRTLIDQLGLTQSDIASRLGEQRSAVANFLRLLSLTENVQELVRSGKLSLGHAKLLASVDDPNEQERLAKLIIVQDLSVRNLERLIQTPNETAEPALPAGPSPHIVDLERTISGQLGMCVQVRSASKDRGRLVIHYGSLDQFDQLLARLNVTVE